MNQYSRLRRVYAILSFWLFMICIGIVLTSHALGMMRGYIGDVIIVMLFYTLVQSFIFGSRRRVALSTVLFALCIELCQYTNILKWFGLSDSPLAVLIFGSIYDPFDLLAYTIGWISIYCIDYYFLTRYFH